MFKKLVVLVAIILMTGIMHTLLYSDFRVNLTVGATYILGVCGLYTMHESFKHPVRRNRWLMLVCGAICVLIAYVTLEGLLRGAEI